jgi:ABC-2 type transport system permease protein
MIAGGAHSLLLFQRSMMHALRMPRAVAAIFVVPVLLLWVVTQVFGELPTVMARFPAASYLMFVAPAIAVVGVLPTALYAGTALFDDRDRGITEHVLATPASQASILLGRMLAAVACAILSGLLVILAAMLGGLGAGGIEHILAVMPLCALLALVYDAAGATLAVVIRRRALLIGLATALLLSSFSLTDLLLPATILPSWLMALSNVNPATYAIHGARIAMTANPGWSAYTHDLLILAIVALLCAVMSLVTFRRCADMQW